MSANTSASLIGHSGSSAFRLSTATVSTSLTGSCFSSESAPGGPSIMGFEDEVEQSFGRPCRQYDCRFKRLYELTSSIVPRGTSFHRWADLRFSRIYSRCGNLPGPSEFGAIDPDAMHDHGQPTRQGHDRLFHPAAPGDLHRPGFEPGPFLRPQHALSCFVEHDPHHLISAARYSAVPIDLARLILGARQPKHGPDCLGFSEASGHVDGGTIGPQRGRHRGSSSDAGTPHHPGQWPANGDAECRPDQHRQVGEVLNKLPDAGLKLPLPNHANLKA